LSILQDIYAELTNAPAITAIVADRVFFRNPQNAQNSPYLVYARQQKERDMVRQKDRFQIVCFSRDSAELETLSDAVVALFEGRVEMNGSEYFKIALIFQSDAGVKLSNGFYWNTLTFEIQAVS